MFVVMLSWLVRRINKVIGRMHRTCDISLVFPQLDANTLRVIVYSDSSFANNQDGSTQLGHCALLADKTGRCSILTYRSYKAKRIVRSFNLANPLVSGLFVTCSNVAAALRSGLLRINNTEFYYQTRELAEFRA
jgi:hypothetical protein